MINLMICYSCYYSRCPIININNNNIQYIDHIFDHRLDSILTDINLFFRATGSANIYIRDSAQTLHSPPTPYRRKRNYTPILFFPDPVILMAQIYY